MSDCKQDDMVNGGILHFNRGKLNKLAARITAWKPPLLKQLPGALLNVKDPKNVETDQ